MVGFLALRTGAILAQEPSCPLALLHVVNDVTQLNPIVVKSISSPKSVAEIQAIVRSTVGPLSIGGGRFSQGGQIATRDTTFVDMRDFNQMVSFSPERQQITVQTGMRWRDIQKIIDPQGLALQNMQSYANFTVGGSLGVNVHGRYIGQGPLISSVSEIKIVLADGTLETASPTHNPELFFGAIGGYGGLGVIVEATLDLAKNQKIERVATKMNLSEYKDYFFREVHDNPNAVLHSAFLYPPAYQSLTSVTYFETDKALTQKARLQEAQKPSWVAQAAQTVLADLPFSREFREHVVDPVRLQSKPVVWRNYEASNDLNVLEPRARKHSTYVLQEYFVPTSGFDAFVPKLGAIFQKHGVNLLNLSVRHARKDPGSLLAWAKEESFAFVAYYKQGVTEEAKVAVGNWTRELIDAALSVGGSYYLPYQIHATEAQFRQAYPRAEEFFALKRKWDPQNRFRNQLWDRYFAP